MIQQRKADIVIGITILYLVGFGALSFFRGRNEPLYYIIIMMIFAIFIARYHRRIDLPFHIITGLALLAWLIPLGGNIFIKDTRLFDSWLVVNLFKYDNLVHIVFGFVAVLITYNFLGPHFSAKLKSRRAILYIVLIIFAAGLGTIIEMVELIAVLALKAQNGVGNYLNNAFDLVFNFVGGGIGTLIVAMYHKEKYQAQAEK